MEYKRFLLLSIISLIIITGCSNPASNHKDVTLSYNANDADSGSAPASGSYIEGSNVTIARNDGGLTKSGYPLFIGWNTAADGSGDFYRPGETMEMPGSNTILYASFASPAEILSSDGAIYDHFGYSVSVSGDYAVFGAPQHNISKGAVYVFHKTGLNKWDSGVELTASDPANGDRFGHSVSIDGNFLVVGAPNKADDNDSSNTNYGKVYVFKRTGTNSWSQNTSLSRTDLSAGDRFGIAVAISENSLAVGAVYADTVYTYLYNEANQWNNSIDSIRPSDISDGDCFGYALAMSSDLLIVGAYNAKGDVTGSGAAYIYQIKSGKTTGQTKVSASNGKNGDLFGVSVDINGDYAIIGANNADEEGNSDQGAAYIFKKYSDSNWGNETKLTAGGGGEQFGYKVSLYGDTAVVGAMEGNDSKGAVYLYTNGSDGWNKSTVLIDTNGTTGDQYCNVALHDDLLVVTASQATIESNTNQGRAQIFNY